MSVVSNDAPATPLGRARAHTVQAHGVVEVNRQALGALEDAEPPEGGHAGESEVEVGQRGVLLQVRPIRIWTYTSIHSELTWFASADWKTRPSLATSAHSICAANGGAA